MRTEIHTLDLNFQNMPELIAAFLAPCPEGGFVLFESGPASTLGALDEETLKLGFDPKDLKAVFLTHIHLDHAAGAGALARRTGAKVYVHPLGSNHLINPNEKLIPSAERLYGEMMIPLWGRVEPIPSTQVVEIGDGETVVVEGLEVISRHTPGHAVHHIAWQIGKTIVTGDVGGVRFPGANYVLPPMPPPDIDVDAWRESIERLQDLDPDRLLLTHFGHVENVRPHFEELDGRLLRWLEIAMRNLTRNDPEVSLADEILALDEIEMAAASIAPEAVQRYRTLCPMDGNSAGLGRYCRLLAKP
ncbi:MAG: MBL fold metallo-hydrolase [Thermoanaerobaculales bacterium]|nr:MBL fold metallo-hydrolase [Thermoanaerobaculales bacterium]